MTMKPAYLTTQTTRKTCIVVPLSLILALGLILSWMISYFSWDYWQFNVIKYPKAFCITSSTNANPSPDKCSPIAIIKLSHMTDDSATNGTNITLWVNLQTGESFSSEINRCSELCEFRVKMLQTTPTNSEH